MTVQDLIKKLQDCDPNKDVAVCPSDENEAGFEFIIEEGICTVFFVAEE